MRHKIEETECTICKMGFPTTDLLRNHTTAAHDAARNVPVNRETPDLTEGLELETTRIKTEQKVILPSPVIPNTLQQNYGKCHFLFP